MAQPSALEAASNDPLLIFAVVILSLATLASVGVSFYLYRWRAILLQNPHTVVPEEWAKHLGVLGQRIGRLTDCLGTELGRIGQRSLESERKVENLVETFMTLQKGLDERDAEIRRLRQGYDNEVFGKFLHRFIRVDQTIKDCLQTGRFDREGFEQARMLLADAFAECGVEVFSPPLGSDYREADGVADSPKLVATETAEDVGKIAEIVEPGYRLKTSQGYDVILPAKIRIYALNA